MLEEEKISADEGSTQAEETSEVSLAKKVHHVHINNVKMLYDKFGNQICPVDELVHQNEGKCVKFNVLLFYPKLIDGKLNLLNVENTDNKKGGIPIIKIIGGGSKPLETVELTAGREGFDETGFTPTVIRFIENYPMWRNDGVRGPHLNLSFEVEEWVGSGRFVNSTETELKKGTLKFLPIRELYYNPIFHNRGVPYGRGHQGYMEDYMKFKCEDKFRTKMFDDAVEFYNELKAFEGR